MNQELINTWNEANQKCLMAAIEAVKMELEWFASRQTGGGAAEMETMVKRDEARLAAERAEHEMPRPSALQNLVSAFGLSLFERKILLMACGVELQADFATKVAVLNGNPMQPLPSLGLALAAFEDAHWSALTPEGPLRYWRMIELREQPLLTAGLVKVNESILHYLAGLSINLFNEMVEPIAPEVYLAPGHGKLAEKLYRGLTHSSKDPLTQPAIVLQGENSDKNEIAAAVASGLGKRLFRISAYTIPGMRQELTEFIRTWNREAALNGYALMVDCHDIEVADKTRIFYLQRFLENVYGPVFIGAGKWTPSLMRKQITAEVNKPAGAEQLWLWKQALGQTELPVNGQVEKLVAQFNLSAGAIRKVGEELLQTRDNFLPGIAGNAMDVKEAIWNMCSRHSRPMVEELAQRIEPVAGWDDIVLPDAQMEILREISMQVRQRKKVYDDWGFGRAGSRGLGISALFSGESGTGKTMAAEVLARDLKLDLYRIDLSQVVNKYIGETEKNLGRIFDAAESGGAILLFDEADALFGKRSEVKDSHDRYGNIEVSYLLQRMETYRGLAILTTNMKNALDKAFLRRIRFVVQFPFPGLVQRAAIWEKVFPEYTPLDNLDWDKLARLSLPGGNIRNIAMNAAFIAADENRPVGMMHIVRAAKTEYTKIDKAMNSIEL